MKAMEIPCKPDRAVGAQEAKHLVAEAMRYQASIQILVGSKSVNAKSLMGMLSLGNGLISPLRLIANGKDEQAAVDAVSAMLRRMLED